MPHFGDREIEAIKRREIEAWKTELALEVRAGTLSPHTVNARLRILLSTLRSAVADYELACDPTRKVKPLDTATWQTYTEEQPNALSVDEVPRFPAKARIATC